MKRLCFYSNNHLTRPRRGTALVFVLGVLTLLALVGLVMMARTHGEFRRVTNQSSASNYRSTMDGMVREIQETLRRDIWGAGANPTIPLGNNNTLSVSGTVEERNEAYDAPGDSDRWLASITPYPILDLNPASPTFGYPVPQATGDPLLPEYNVLAWPYVSYLGTDLLQTMNHKPPAAPNSSDPEFGTTPFVWATNSRVPVPSPVYYSTNSLKNIPILQAPPPTVPGGNRAASLIPGSTTNVTIASARAEWSSMAHLQALAALPEFASGAGRVPRFPYFDTNADGILDLYDADGDGIPDSPLSMELPIDGSDPNAPRRLYAAVRIIDHAGMLNVNVASSLRRPNAASTAESSDLTFNEALAGLQRRGRRTTEQLLDELIHSADRNYDPSDLTRDRGKGTVQARRSGDRPDDYDRDIIRTKLLGGRATTSLTYYPFGLSEEASLRHRGMLVPYERRFDAASSGGDYSNVDRALRNTLLWTRQTAVDGTYTGPTPRWTRLVSDYLNPSYEGADNAGGEGWRTLLCEDEPAAVRRHLMTTLSHEVIPPPDIVQRSLLPGETLGNAIDARLLQLWSLGMDWPVFIASNSSLATDTLRPANSFTDKFILPVNRMPPDALRVQPIDLNMGDANFFDVKTAFIRYLAAAMYLALDGQGSYQGVNLSSAPLNREYLAWQFALNVADYRDGDNEPTVLEWPAGMSPPHYLFGVEKQPFFTEAYAFLKAGTASGPGPSSGGPDEWFFAVELFVPPYWRIPSDNLYLMIPQPGTLPPRRYALSDFQHRTAGTPPNVMSGGAAGKYYVFCGINANAPSSIQTNPLYAEFYQFVPKPGLTDFQLPIDGTGQVQLVYESASVPRHHLDVIGGDYCDVNGDNNADLDVLYLGKGNASYAPVTTFAMRPANINPGEQHEFTLIRSTNGWRFTTAWHHYADERAPGPSPASSRPVPKSLGLPNEPTANPLDPNTPAPLNKTRWLDRIIPESIWPARATLSGGALPGGFAALSPYQSFDSPADLSKLLIIGSLTQINVAPPQIEPVNNFIGNIGVPSGASIPPTAIIVALCRDRVPGQNDDTTPRYLHYASVGRIDYWNPTDPQIQSQVTVSRRLMNSLTTVSPLFDGVDNDGNGLTDMADPNEALIVLNKVVGRINVNTAPASVLRCVPYMSLLPTSPEYLFHVVMSGGVNPIPAGYNPFAVFSVPTPRPYWDMASAIVATREATARNSFRDASNHLYQGCVPLRFLDTDPGYTPPTGVNTRLRTAAMASVYTPAPGPGPTSGSGSVFKGAFQNIADLARLTDREDHSLSNDAHLFNIDRFSRDSRLRPLSHRHFATADPVLGIESVLSPDYRFTRISPTEGLVEYSAIPRIVPAQQEVELGGLRSRDVLLARWANHLTVRSDVFTAYIALIDENGRYIERSEVTIDRSQTFREAAPASGQPRRPILPLIQRRLDTSYTDDTK